MVIRAMDGKKVDQQIPAVATTKDFFQAENRIDIQLVSPPVLPSHAAVKYLNEGSANIIYVLSVTHLPGEFASSSRDTKQNGATMDNVWNGKLLRLRKDLPWTAPCAIAQADFLRNVYPLFRRENLVEQRLVDLSSSGVIARLNYQLHEWDEASRGDLRSIRWHGKYLANDDHGLLVEDMTSSISSGVELLEFKPKWLTQSRSAPALSKRCRTCAKRARNNALRARAGDPLVPHFCPLDLVSNDEEALQRAIRTILGIADPVSPSDSLRLYRVSQWARKSPILSQLATLQSSLDPVGVFAADPTNSQFLTAMTLRDCSLFLQVPEHDLTMPLIAKIGDLDLKRPEKSEYWKDVERPLLQEGWYMGEENEVDRQPLTCNLSPRY